jgi:hypothetical protein
MTHSDPTCDRHPNLQMVSCWLKRSHGVVAGHVCPVPGCGRYHVDERYLNAADIELVLSTNTRSKRALQTSTTKKDLSKKHSLNQDRPLNRHAAARAAILKAIEQKQQP